MLVGQPLRVLGVAAEGDEQPALDASVGECPKKLAHGLHADVPGLPVLALDRGARSVLFDYQVDAAVRVSTAAPADRIALLAVNQGDEVLELEPVDGSELLDEGGGSLRLVLRQRGRRRQRRIECCERGRVEERLFFRATDENHAQPNDDSQEARADYENPQPEEHLPDRRHKYRADNNQSDQLGHALGNVQFSVPSTSCHCLRSRCR